MREPFPHSERLAGVAAAKRGNGQPEQPADEPTLVRAHQLVAGDPP